MAIASTDIKFFLSGGSANGNPDASIGGAISATEFVDNTLNNLFSKIIGDESAAGHIEYRCLYVKNTHATLTLEIPKFYLDAKAGSPDTTFEIGVGAAAKNATESAIGNDKTAPSGVTFAAPEVKAAGLSLPNLAPGDAQAIWFKYIIAAGASAFNNDGITFNVAGDTAA